MARLENGLETMELGVTSWRLIINDNFTKVYAKSEVDELLKGNEKTSFKAKDFKVNGVFALNALKVDYKTKPKAPDGFFKINLNGKDVAVPYYEIKKD